MPAFVSEIQKYSRHMVPLAVLAAGFAASPALSAQQLGGQYIAYTTITRTGDHAGATTIGNDTAASAVPQYSSQVTGSGTQAVAFADDTNGGTVSAYVAAVYDPNEVGNYINGLYATAQSNYYFSLIGPSTTTWVPVNIRATGSAANGKAYFGFIDSEGEYYGDAFDTFGASANSWDRRGFDVNRTVNLRAGRIYSLVLQASAAAFTYALGPGDIQENSASVDPTLTILGDLGQSYKFVGLPASAIGNVAAVPEPASWAMMVGGFGVLGGALRRQRKAAAAALA